MSALAADEDPFDLFADDVVSPVEPASPVSESPQVLRRPGLVAVQVKRPSPSSVAKRPKALTSAVAIQLRHASDVLRERREPQWLIHRVLERSVLAVLAGPRGSFKSFVALDWMMRVATHGLPVVILSGEGGGLDRRMAAWLQAHAPSADPASLPVFVLERALDLTADEVLDDLAVAIDSASTVPAAVLVDTLSKFSPGLDENDNADVAEYLHRLSAAIRDRYECTVLLVAHSGHGDAKRPRGASALMANPDAEYIIERPDPVGMLVTVSRERFKDTPSLPALAYKARIVDLGRCDSYGEPVTSLAIEPTDTPPVKPAGKWGRNQLAAIGALKEWARAHPDSSHISTPDMAALLKAQGIRHQRRYEVLNSLVNARILTASIGGYTFDREAL